MKKLLTYCLSLSTLLFAISCGDDNVVSPSDTQVNKNLNHPTSAQAEVHDACLKQSWKDVARRIEIPRLTGDELFVIHATSDYGLNYCIGYDREKKAARWSAYCWHAGNARKGWVRKNWEKTEWGGDPFQVDPLIPSAYRATLENHASNGYDRGHIIGSEDRICSRDFNEQTFYLSNMHPQLSTFNQRGIWFNLENRLRDNYNIASFRDTLYVVKGGTIRNDQLLEVRKGLPVPKFFYMAILCKNKQTSQGGYKAIAFWMEHNSDLSNATNYKKYAISIDRLEELTGIDFFCNLPDDIEEQVERNMVPAVWGL